MPAPRELLQRWPVIVVLALAAHLAFGIFGRGLWKPDEPREAAIAARMARPGADLAVPHLGATPFCEKPPLYYWIAAASARVAGAGAVGLRLPNLAYALAGALLAGLLANAAAGRAAALAAGLLMGTLYLAYRVEIWIATDALLMMSVAGALLGAYRGFVAGRGRPKLAWYAVMHAFLAVGFLAKNVVAWVVPVLALCVVIAWERRWRELVAWELWAPFAIQLAAVLPWVAAVAARPDGAAYLRVFFLDNLVGRFTEVPGVGYTRSHPGSPGAYLVQLPVFLLPWTLLFVAAAAAAWRACASGARRTAWRFAAAAVAPGLLVLSASATARDIYAGVLMPGCALLGALWVERALAAPARLDVAMAKATSVFLLIVAVALPPAALATVARLGMPAPVPALVILAVGWVTGGVLAARSWRSARAGRLGPFLAAACGCWIVAWSGWAPLVFPVINRAQDIAPVARAAAEVASRHPIALWRPDETIIGVLDYESSLTPPAITEIGRVREALAARPDLHLVAEVTRSKSKEAAVAPLRDELHFTVLRRIDLPEPGGRSYEILAPPPAR